MVKIILMGSFHSRSLTKINKGRKHQPKAVWPDGNESCPGSLLGPGGENHGV